MDAGFRDLALGAVGPGELERLIAEDETLFVEHKSGIGAPEKSFQIVKAAASFANQFGGWILVGVRDCRPTEWEIPRGPFVNAVRQRLDGRIDPMPPFAATLRELDGAAIGLIRIYPSSDTPHIATDTGAIYVREVAEDRDRGKRAYAAREVGSQLLLLELAQRGSLAREQAETKLKPASCPFVDETLSLRYDYVASEVDRRTPVLQLVPGEAAIAVRLAPLTVTPRFRDWAVSEASRDAVMHAAESLTDGGRINEDPGALRVHAQGISAAAVRASQSRESSLRLPVRRAVVTVDAAGVVGTQLTFMEPRQGEMQPETTLAGIVGLIEAPLRALASLLERHEVIGRASAHADIQLLGHVLRMHEGGRTAEWPGWIPVGGDITVPASAGDVEAVAASWARAIARAGNLVVLG